MDTEATTIEQQIIDTMRKLNTETKRQLLDYARGLELGRPRGEAGKEFLERIRDIGISREDLEAMQQAIDEAEENYYGFNS